jgi:hypothetical protein
MGLSSKRQSFLPLFERFYEKTYFANRLLNTAKKSILELVKKVFLTSFRSKCASLACSGFQHFLVHPTAERAENAPRKRDKSRSSGRQSHPKRISNEEASPFIASSKQQSGL